MSSQEAQEVIDAILLFEDDVGCEILSDQATRIAISRNYPFSRACAEYLFEYIVRQPIERFRNGVTVDHFLEIFERCKSKQKDPLQKKLVEADRVYFGINERKERNEKKALKLYEELAYELPEARSMCLAIYNHKLALLMDDDAEGPETGRYRRQIADLTIRQISNKQFTPIVLFCLHQFEELPDFPTHVYKKIDSAFDLAEKHLPLRCECDHDEDVVECAHCECSFYEKFAIQCDFFEALFCSVECQLLKFICEVFDGYYCGYSPKAVESLSFPKDVNKVEYLDLDDPARLVEHFKVKTLLKPGYQTYLKRSVKEKAFDKCAILLRDPLTEYIKKPFESPPEVPIRSLWCQAALLLGHFQKQPEEEYIQMLYANCLFLLESGVLSSLPEEEALKALEDLSNILDLAIDAEKKLPPVEVSLSITISQLTSSG